ncbi:hypothetical protein M426DRAFT_158467 [Hypoxylon sp. CI-4A]|nr:hypothetical protein M426DRAFT_158467 [Hypoxylon sp. CI-4A]
MVYNMTFCKYGQLRRLTQHALSCRQMLALELIHGSFLLDQVTVLGYAWCRWIPTRSVLHAKNCLLALMASTGAILLWTVAMHISEI